MFYGAKELNIEVNGGNITVLQFGSGAKPLVMIPGLRMNDLKGSSAAAALGFRMFAKNYTVCLFDRKIPAEQGCTIHDLAEDLFAAMRKLNIDNAFVFGVSQGGMIAQDLAVHHPSSVKKLALGVTAARTNETIETVIQRWLKLAETAGLSAVAEDYMLTACSEEYIRRYRHLIHLALKLQKTMPADRFMILARSILSCNTYNDLERISCPVLVLGGMQDRIVTPEASMEIADQLHCEYHMYENYGHEAYAEAKDFNRRVYDFFEKDE